MTRREWIPLAAAAMFSGYAGFRGGRNDAPRRSDRASVTLRKGISYESDLADLILKGLLADRVDVRGQKVLLKPHLAAFSPDGAENTHPAVLAAAYAAFRDLGAAEVRIGEAPEQHRDTWALAEAAGYRERIPNFDEVFIDLNGDDVSPVEGVASGRSLYLPVTALRADLVVSLGKMKADPKLGAALSMTNLFGLIPGSVYGWPTEKVHGEDGAKTTTELARVFRRGYAIVDGIWALGKDGIPEPAGILAMGSDLAAVDATCCRVMGLDPQKIGYLKLAANRQGVIDAARIDQRGDAL